MMYGTGQAREPRSLGRRMSDSVIAAVCTGLMAVLCIGMLWAMSHVDNSGRLGAGVNGTRVFVLLVKECPWRRRSLFCCSGRRA